VFNETDIDGRGNTVAAAGEPTERHFLCFFCLEMIKRDAQRLRASNALFFPMLTHVK
jgi:hypothetical protein